VTGAQRRKQLNYIYIFLAKSNEKQIPERLGDGGKS
jgi:hypothetical protein